MNTALQAHLATGLTTVCRVWRIVRRDGVRFGFTDHDRDIAFGGLLFRAETGMTAKSLTQSAGLSVDNSEAMGILSDPAVTEADIEAGRYDGAEVTAWVVNWQDPTQREVRFKGTIGEISRGGGAFHAELRGLAEPLNLPVGRAYQPTCDAQLGDGACGFDLGQPGFTEEVVLTDVDEGRVLRFADTGQIARFFVHGRLEVLDGAAQGLVGMVRDDQRRNGNRIVSLWEALRAEVRPGDRVRVQAGCNKLAATCKAKFDNFLNFRGFPHIPGEDWLAAVPRRSGRNVGGKRDD